MKKTETLLLAALAACILFAGCAAGPPRAESAATAPAAESAPPASEAPSESAPGAPGEEPPEPVYGNQIQDGTYPIEVSSSSSMFRIVDAQLTVENGEMSAVLTLGGKGYEKLYMGTGEQALADTDDNCVYFSEDAQGRYTYRVPVAALDRETDCAAWSIRKEKWYDRVLVFHSAQLPAGAVSAASPGELPADGRYLVDVSLSGGSGRASVESPAKVTVADGRATAVVVWSSPYYESMRVDGAVYAPIPAGGNSAFEIPVTLDADMAVSARTIAMSEPHDVDYILRFNSATAAPSEPQ